MIFISNSDTIQIGGDIVKIVTEIKKLFLNADTTQADVANRINTTQSNLSTKLKNNTLYSKDIENIADTLGYDIKIEFHKKE